MQLKDFLISFYKFGTFLYLIILNMQGSSKKNVHFYRKLCKKYDVEVTDGASHTKYGLTENIFGFNSIFISV